MKATVSTRGKKGFKGVRTLVIYNNVYNKKIPQSTVLFNLNKFVL